METQKRNKRKDREMRRIDERMTGEENGMTYGERIEKRDNDGEFKIRVGMRL